MRSRHRAPKAPPLTALAVAALAVAGCASSGPAPASPAPSADEATVSELEALFRERQAAALDEVHPADVAFVTGMIGHHAQALTMSGYAPEAGASPAVRTLAARIINAQRDEITNMQRWLRDRELPVPAVAEDGTVTFPQTAPAEAGGMDEGARHHGAMGHEGMDHGDMPGMLSPAQLNELSRARGTDFDRLFLTYMIQHHQGAVTMVHDLFAQDGAAQDELIFKLASDVQVDQITEINRMQLMLDELGTSGPG
jgi:uncharacterized protein (DUF305 family)